MDLVKNTEETPTQGRLMGGRKKSMTMPRIVAIACTCAALVTGASAADFAIGIAGSVAGRSLEAKSAAMVARPDGCADPATARIEGTAEGLVNGARRSITLKLVPLPDTQGVVAVNKEWPAEGVWVVKLTGTCKSAKAGVVVPFGPKGFLRESSKFFSRAANEAEVEASLKALAHQK
jgi:hypothetical protein